MTETSTRVWDAPVRLCHWAMALCIPALWWTAENGEMGWHMRTGLFLLFVLTFRILWGFFGTRTARFAQFVKGPIGTWQYLIGKAPHDSIGHNPLGALSTLILLGVLLGQVSLGLFAGDPFDGATGPLNDKVGVMTADWMTDWHEIVFDGIVILSALHIVAIAIYWVVQKNNLITPMITGSRVGTRSGSGIGKAPLWRAIVCAVFAGALTVWIQQGAPPL